MTLQRLNEHLNMVLELQRATELLSSLQSQMSGVARFDGMPHSHEVSRSTENIALALRSHIEEVKRLEAIVQNSDREVREFVNSIGDTRTRLIFNLRFLCGLKWDAIPSFLGGGITPEAIKAVCYRYLEQIGETDCDAL